MNRRVLFVDDEKNILESFKRQLHNDFVITVCDNPFGALEIVQQVPQFAVVVADFSMPGMDGVTFLKRFSQFSFETVRLILTGNAELNIAMKAVNECNIFRFLAKPCPIDDLKRLVNEGITQYRLNTLMSEYLKPMEKTGELVSVCSNCRKVKLPHEDPFSEENWKLFELFFAKEYGFRFTHGLCPSCVEVLYSDMKNRKQRKI